MINTGIVRKIDELGRIVLPKELRKSLNINSGDDLEIIVYNKKIILEKYSKLESIESKLIKIIDCFNIDNKYNIFVTKGFKLINYNNEEVSNNIKEIILSRKTFISDRIEKNIINDNISLNGKSVIMPIVIDSDLLGSIIIISNESIKELINLSKIIYNIIKMTIKLN